MTLKFTAQISPQNKALTSNNGIKQSNTSMSADVTPTCWPSQQVHSIAKQVAQREQQDKATAASAERRSRKAEHCAIRAACGCGACGLHAARPTLGRDSGSGEGDQADSPRQQTEPGAAASTMMHGEHKQKPSSAFHARARKTNEGRFSGV